VYVLFVTRGTRAGLVHGFASRLARHRGHQVKSQGIGWEVDDWHRCFKGHSYDRSVGTATGKTDLLFREMTGRLSGRAAVPFECYSRKRDLGSPPSVSESYEAIGPGEPETLSASVDPGSHY